MNVRETVGTVDGLKADDFLAIWPEREAEVAATKARALANSLYRNYVISADGTVASIFLEVETYRDDDTGDLLSAFDGDTQDLAQDPAERVKTSGADDSAILAAIYAVLERHIGENLEYYVAGSTVLNAGMSTHIASDMGVFTGLSVAVIGFFSPPSFVASPPSFSPS